MTYREALELAKDYDSKLRADDKRFRGSVSIVHRDGSIFSIKNAFLMKRKSKKFSYVFMFSEHFGFMIFEQDDLVVCDQNNPNYSEIGSLT